MRLFWLISILVQAALLANCSRQSHGQESQQIDLRQNVTVQGQSGSSDFKDFNSNWRHFVSTSPQLAAPVLGGTVKREPATQPIISADCVFSREAGRYMPRVTVTWNEPAAQPQKLRAESGKTTQAEVPVLRFDLGLHYKAFERNYFSSILSTDKLQRFRLPSNSSLANNQEAVLLTGPGLFPKLMDFSIQTFEDHVSKRRFDKITVALQDLNQGISYNMRVSRLAGDAWNADRQIVFVPPVCPNSY